MPRLVILTSTCLGGVSAVLHTLTLTCQEREGEWGRVGGQAPARPTQLTGSVPLGGAVFQSRPLPPRPETQAMREPFLSTGFLDQAWP